MKNRWVVITTINSPTKAIGHISGLCGDGWSAVVVGDTKTPKDWAAASIEFLSVAAQGEMFREFSGMVPYRHYSRKNLGYLYAIAKGADLILETDDDNLPYPSFGKDINPKVTGRLVGADGWVNVYKYFTDALIWPRGLPLGSIHSSGDVLTPKTEAVCPVQQFLADTDPDVDAIYRLIFKGPVDFDPGAEPVILSKGAWVPFNSQNTIFFKEAFPLLYLPCFVSFRMTDIWRSFVAAQALWVHGLNLSFHASTVMQERNAHDLMRDFADEVPGYLNNDRISKVLSSAASVIESKGPSSIAETARALWKSLITDGLIPKEEERVVDAWFSAVERLHGSGR